MNRRAFAGYGLAAVGGIFVPQYGRWFHRLRPVEISTYLVTDPPYYRIVQYKLSDSTRMYRLEMSVSTDADARVWTPHETWAMGGVLHPGGLLRPGGTLLVSSLPAGGGGSGKGRL